METWEVELAADYTGDDVVFRSGHVNAGDQITITTDMGAFTGSLQGQTQLASGNICFCRVRQKSTKGEWSAWSRWHQPVKVSGP
jgi:hypothetical protein